MLRPALLILMLSLCPPVTAQVSMEVLPTPAGLADCDAWDVNDRGEIIGYCLNQLTDFIPVYWLDGVATVLDGPVEAADGTSAPFTTGLPRGVNQAGEIFAVVIGSTIGGSAIWTGSSWLLLEPGFVVARAINDRGDVTGTLANQVVILSDSGDLILLPGIPSMSCTPMTMNNKREVAGFCHESGDMVPVVWDNHGEVSVLPGDHLQPEIGQSNFGRGMNAKGVVVGSDSGKAIRWGADTTVLALLGSANDIDNSGNAVGYLGINGGVGANVPRAVLWPAGTSLQILLGNSLGGDQSWARAINNTGMIVGFAFDNDGVKHAVVWR